MHAARAAVPAAIVLAAITIAVIAGGSLSPATGVAASRPARHAPAVSPMPTPTLPPHDLLLSALVRSDGEGGSKVTVARLTPEYLRLSSGAGMGLDSGRYLVFRILVESATLETSTWDLKGMVYLRDSSGIEYGSPLWLPVDDPYRKIGLAAFPNRDSRGNPIPSIGSRFMEIVLRDLSGVRERVFRWDLD